MVKLLLPVGSLQRSASRRGVPVGVACVLGAFLASCATGAVIEDDDVIVISSARPSTADPDALEGAGDGVESSANEGAGDGALQPASGETSQEGDDEDLPRSEQPGDGDPSSQPADEDPAGSDSEPLPPVDVPIVDTDDPTPGPGPGSNPIIEPDPVPEPPEDDDDPPAPDPVVPPVTNPDLNPDPLEPDDALPAAGHCLAGWEGSSCDVCSGQTQSDRLSCRLYIDCYIVSDCDPASCGSVEQVCGVNRLGNGLAPKEIADSVYGCMCAP